MRGFLRCRRHDDSHFQFFSVTVPRSSAGMWKGGRMSPPPDPAAHEENLLVRAGAGDAAALDELLAVHRPLMRRVVEVRMDAALRGRIDPSDVVQEAQLEVARRIRDFLNLRQMPFAAWVRQTTFENLLRMRRQHVDAECRTVVRERPLP